MGIASKRIAPAGLAALALGLGSAGPASAATIASDNFESYPAGGAAGLNGGSGFTAGYVSDNSNAVNVAAETLSYGSGAVTSAGGSKDLQITSATTGTNTNAGATGVDNGTLGRTFAAQTGTVYFSMLLRGNVTSNNEFVQVGLSNATGGEPALSFGLTGGSGTAAATFFLRVPGGNSTTSAIPFNPGQTYLLVGKASASGANGSSYDRIDLFVNPSSATEPAAPTVTRTANSGLGGLSTLNFRTARFFPGDVYSVDNVLLGTTYADVVPTPEPASLGALGVAAAGLLARRRRVIR